MKIPTTPNLLEKDVNALEAKLLAESFYQIPRRVFNPPSGPNGRPIIGRLLIANCSEIACRVIATCRELNITSIVVYTDLDSQSLHVKEADQAVRLGTIDGPDGNPHQNIDLLIHIALAHEADSIHPGYGYLSENAAFAQCVRDANLIFVGPSPKSMAVLGDKRSAKIFLSKHAPEVPLIPGYNGSAQEIHDLLREAEYTGFPILIKASAGGGGSSSSTVDGASEGKWVSSDLLVDIDGHRWRVLTVNEADHIGYDAGAFQKFYCHVPALGILVEYHRFSLLTLGESLRDLAGASEAHLDHNPKAPMPCKVLTILKKEGETVKKGDIAIVVESMKMETNVLATTEGVFNAKVAKGDAVEEGTVLFTIT